MPTSGLTQQLEITKARSAAYAMLAHGFQYPDRSVIVTLTDRDTETRERYRNPDRELLAVLQLFRRSNQIISRYEIKKGPKVYEAQRNGKKYEMYNDTVIAFNRGGKEIFRTDVEEPVYVRPAKHANTI